MNRICSRECRTLQAQEICSRAWTYREGQVADGRGKIFRMKTRKEATAQRCGSTEDHMYIRSVKRNLARRHSYGEKKSKWRRNLACIHSSYGEKYRNGDHRPWRRNPTCKYSQEAHGEKIYLHITTDATERRMLHPRREGRENNTVALCLQFHRNINRQTCQFESAWIFLS